VLSPDSDRLLNVPSRLPANYFSDGLRRGVLGDWVADQRASRNLQDVLIEVLTGIIEIVHNESWKSVSSAYPTVMRHKFGNRRMVESSAFRKGE